MLSERKYAGDPGGHLPVDPGEVPVLPAANQPGLEELNKTQFESQQEFHEGKIQNFQNSEL